MFSNFFFLSFVFLVFLRTWSDCLCLSSNQNECYYATFSHWVKTLVLLPEIIIHERIKMNHKCNWILWSKYFLVAWELQVITLVFARHKTIIWYYFFVYFLFIFFIYDKNFNLNLHAHVYFEDLENQTYTLRIKLFQKENYPGQIPM